MDDEPYDIHPLDRDYSEPVVYGRRELTQEQRVRRIGLATFATGFVLVLLAGFLTTVFRRVMWIESFGSVVHQFAMVTILIGGLILLASYRWGFLQQLASEGVKLSRSSSDSITRAADSAFAQPGPASPRSAGFAPLVPLLLANVVGFGILVATGFLWSSIGGGSATSLIINLLITLSFALMVTWVVYHRGVLRAYAIGVLVGLVINVISLGAGFSGLWWSNPATILISHLLAIQLSGMLCAAYFCSLPAAQQAPSSAAEPAERHRSSSRAQPDAPFDSAGDE